MSLAPGWRAVGSGLICFIAAEVRSGSHGSQRHQEDSSSIGCLDRWVPKAHVQAPQRLGSMVLPVVGRARFTPGWTRTLGTSDSSAGHDR